MGPFAGWHQMGSGQKEVPGKQEGRGEKAGVSSLLLEAIIEVPVRQPPPQAAPRGSSHPHPFHQLAPQYSSWTALFSKQNLHQPPFSKNCLLLGP